MSGDLLSEFDGSDCPACHHRAHDPGSCSECPRCELHTDEAMAFVLRYEPELVVRAARQVPPVCTCLPLNRRLMAHLLMVTEGSVHEQGCWERAAGLGAES